MHQSVQQPDMLTQFTFREFWQHLLFSSLLQFNRMLIDGYLNVLFQLPILGLEFFLVRYPSLAGFLEDPRPVQMTHWFSWCLATLCLGYPDFSYLPCSSYGCKLASLFLWKVSTISSYTLEICPYFLLSFYIAEGTCSSNKLHKLGILCSSLVFCI